MSAIAKVVSSPDSISNASDLPEQPRHERRITRRQFLKAAPPVVATAVFAYYGVFDQPKEVLAREYGQGSPTLDEFQDFLNRENKERRTGKNWQDLFQISAQGQRLFFDKSVNEFTEVQNPNDLPDNVIDFSALFVDALVDKSTWATLGSLTEYLEFKDIMAIQAGHMIFVNGLNDTIYEEKAMEAIEAVSLVESDEIAERCKMAAGGCVDDSGMIVISAENLFYASQHEVTHKVFGGLYNEKYVKSPDHVTESEIDGVKIISGGFDQSRCLFVGQGENYTNVDLRSMHEFFASFVDISSKYSFVKKFKIDRLEDYKTTVSNPYFGNYIGSDFMTLAIAFIDDWNKDFRNEMLASYTDLDFVGFISMIAQLIENTDLESLTQTAVRSQVVFGNVPLDIAAELDLPQNLGDDFRKSLKFLAIVSAIVRPTIVNGLRDYGTPIDDFLKYPTYDPEERAIVYEEYFSIPDVDDFEAEVENLRDQDTDFLDYYKQAREGTSNNPNFAISIRSIRESLAGEILRLYGENQIFNNEDAASALERVLVLYASGYRYRLVLGETNPRLTDPPKSPLEIFKNFGETIIGPQLVESNFLQAGGKVGQLQNLDQEKDKYFITYDDDGSGSSDEVSFNINCSKIPKVFPRFLGKIIEMKFDQELEWGNNNVLRQEYEDLFDDVYTAGGITGGIDLNEQIMDLADELVNRDDMSATLLFLIATAPEYIPVSVITNIGIALMNKSHTLEDFLGDSIYGDQIRELKSYLDNLQIGEFDYFEGATDEQKQQSFQLYKILIEATFMGTMMLNALA